MGTSVEQEVMCPKCGGQMWDNRLSKRNPKAPDFKCRDKGCDGVVWPPKNGQAQPRAAAPRQAANTPQPVSYGHIPGLDDGQDAAEQAFVQSVRAPAPAPAPQGRPDFPALVRQYNECVAAAEAALHVSLVDKGIPVDAEAVVAAAATLFIQRARAGV